MTGAGAATAISGAAGMAGMACPSFDIFRFSCLILLLLFVVATTVGTCRFVGRAIFRLLVLVAAVAFVTLGNCCAFSFRW